MKSEPVRIPEPVAEAVKGAVNGLQQLVKEQPKKKDEIVRNFKRHMDYASMMSAPAPKPIQLPPSREKRGDTSDQFMLSMTQLAAASEFLKPIPTAMLTQILKDMKPETAKGLIGLLSQQVSVYEQLFGEIKTQPPSQRIGRSSPAGYDHVEKRESHLVDRISELTGIAEVSIHR